MKNNKVKFKINQKENQISIRINPKIYPLEAIYGACYVFLDKAYLFLDGNPQKEILVSLKGKEKLNRNQLKELKGKFNNELLNYALRSNIASRNTKIREYIVGTALFSVAPSDSDHLVGKTEISGEEDYIEDPLDIAVPWEEKYGKKKGKKSELKN